MLNEVACEETNLQEKPVDDMIIPIYNNYFGCIVLALIRQTSINPFRTASAVSPKSLGPLKKLTIDLHF